MSESDELRLEGHDLPARNADELARLVRALSKHRYVAAHGLYVHAALIRAVAQSGAESSSLGDATGHAASLLASMRELDGPSDPRLLVRLSPEAASDVIHALGSNGGERVRAWIRAWLERGELGLADYEPFDERRDLDVHPLLIDAGWELVPLGDLDSERHAGAMRAFGDEGAFAEAVERERSRTAPTLQELSAFGPIEVLRGFDDDGSLASSCALYTYGEAAYLDYVLRGAVRAAKLG